jgi:hypothetical protein
MYMARSPVVIFYFIKQVAPVDRYPPILPQPGVQEWNNTKTNTRSDWINDIEIFQLLPYILLFGS